MHARASPSRRLGAPNCSILSNSPTRSSFLPSMHAERNIGGPLKFQDRPGGHAGTKTSEVEEEPVLQCHSIMERGCISDIYRIFGNGGMKLVRGGAKIAHDIPGGSQKERFKCRQCSLPIRGNSGRRRPPFGRRPTAL